MSTSPKARKSREETTGSRLHPTSAPSKMRNKCFVVRFPTSLLKRIDGAVRRLGTTRSQLIQNAVEHLLDEIEAKKFENELSCGYAANAEMNRALAAEFAEVEYAKPTRSKRRLRLDPPLIRPAGRRIDLTNDKLYELVRLP